MSLDQYKRRFGLLLDDGRGNWRGSTSDPYGRYDATGGEYRHRTLSLESDPALIGLRMSLGSEGE